MYTYMHSYLQAYSKCGQTQLLTCIYIYIYMYVHVCVYICILFYKHTHTVAQCSFWILGVHRAALSICILQLTHTNDTAAHTHQWFWLHLNLYTTTIFTTHTTHHGQHRVSPPDIQLDSTPIMTTLWPLLSPHHNLYNYTLHTHLLAPTRQDFINIYYL